MINNEYIEMQDASIYELKLKNFNWGYENIDCHSIWRTCADRYRLLQAASGFSSDHVSLWKKYSSN